jgi:hypothetical protein
LLLGDQGVEGAQLFRQLLDYAGYHRDAAQVGALLAGPG